MEKLPGKRKKYSTTDRHRTLMEEGNVTPVIDRRYRLSEAAEAVRYVEEGHARGKVIIDFIPSHVQYAA